jgi:opacity protein-like surface antigen
MKKLLTALLILGLSTAASPVLAAAAKSKMKKSAPAEKSLKWFVDLGPTLPMGDFSETNGIGFTGGVGAEHALSFGKLLYKAHYSSWGGKDYEVLGTTFEGFTISQMDLFVDYKYEISTSGSAAPYLIGGLGFSRATIEIAIPTVFGVGGGSVSASSTGIGIEVGGGVDFPVGSATMFVEAAYIISEIDSLPIKVGFRF